MQKIARGRSARNLHEASFGPAKNYNRHAKPTKPPPRRAPAQLQKRGGGAAGGAAGSKSTPQQRAAQRRAEQSEAALTLQKVTRGKLTRRGVLGAKPRAGRGGRGGRGGRAGGGGGGSPARDADSDTVAVRRLQAVARGKSERLLLAGLPGKAGVSALQQRRERLARRYGQPRLNSAPDMASRSAAAAMRIQAASRGRTHRNSVKERREALAMERDARAAAYAAAHDPARRDLDPRSLRKPPLGSGDVHGAAKRLQKVQRGKSARRLLARGVKHALSANASRGADATERFAARTSLGGDRRCKTRPAGLKKAPHPGFHLLRFDC